MLSFSLGHDHLYSFCMGVTVLAWLFLLCLPRFFLTKIFVRSGFIPLFFSVVYTLLFVIAAAQGRVPWGPDFGSFTWLKTLFANEQVLLAGWIHYLCFDLYVGCHILKGLEDRQQDHWLSRWVLLSLTFLAGPAGYLASKLLWNTRKFPGSR